MSNNTTEIASTDDRIAKLEALTLQLVESLTAPAAPAEHHDYRDHLPTPEPAPAAREKVRTRPQPEERQEAPKPAGITVRKAKAKAKTEPAPEPAPAEVQTAMRLRWTGKGVVGEKKLGRSEGNPSQYKEFALERVNVKTGEVITRQMFGSRMVLDITDFAGVECPAKE